MEKLTLRVSQAFTYSFTNTFRGKPPPPKAHHVHCENSKQTDTSVEIFQVTGRSNRGEYNLEGL